MAKYTVSINAHIFHELAPELSLNDAAILEYLRDICTSQNKKIALKRVSEDEYLWTWVNYSHLINEMPYLHIKSRGTVSKTIKKLKDVGFVDSIRKTGNKVYIRLLDKADDLVFSKEKQLFPTEKQNFPTEKPSNTNQLFPTEKNQDINNNQDTNINSEVERLFKYYKKKINSRAILTTQAKDKIKTRLKEYKLKELGHSIKRFSNNIWRMEHNSDKPLTWFFRSEEQIATFLQLKQDVEKTKLNIYKEK